MMIYPGNLAETMADVGKGVSTCCRPLNHVGKYEATLTPLPFFLESTNQKYFSTSVVILRYYKKMYMDIKYKLYLTIVE